MDDHNEHDRRFIIAAIIITIIITIIMTLGA